MNFQELSPYDFDNSVSVLFSEFNTMTVNSQNNLTALTEKLSQTMPVFAQLFKSNPDVRYVVDMDGETIAAIESGLKTLDSNKKGQLFAQFRDHGKYSDKIPIKKEYYDNLFSPAELMNYLQIAQIQDQLQEIISQLTVIDNHISEISKGMQNDRIALYYSGVSLFIESQNTDNDELKNSLIAQSISALSQAYFQLSMNLKLDIGYLVNREYSAERGKNVELINKRMSEIDKEFDVIHKAAMFKAAIYCHCGEYASMTNVLNTYSKFINATVAQNAQSLIEYDTRDDGSDNGIWHTRANLSLDVSELSRIFIGNHKTEREAIALEA